MPIGPGYRFEFPISYIIISKCLQPARTRNRRLDPRRLQDVMLGTLAYLVPSVSEPAQHSAIISDWSIIPLFTSGGRLYCIHGFRMSENFESWRIDRSGILTSNLLVASSRSKAFTLPEQYRKENGGTTYDYVLISRGDGLQCGEECTSNVPVDYCPSSVE
ncbi:hypothetical protein H4Q26_012841 [Puccinia striiformis f. sp. tritici PST-130]|nr:hypothetical protein H4Q26_012841 [Puccinia striiformis f. sp. tritici PST-130]